MSNLPHELKYSKSHEWVRDEGDGTYTVGITDHAQGLLGDMVFVELPELERVVNAEEECAVVESVKAASDVYAPVGGTVTEVNSAVEESPELVNQDPYGDGWLFKLSDISGLDDLLDADDYAEMVDES
jgi:glycine cleavage system H protein